MSQWYYTRNQQQNGPVAFEELKQIAASGGISPSDMVWNPPMPDWIPASSVQGLFPTSSNPYHTPASTFTEGVAAPPSLTGEVLTEIEPGSQPIDIGACIERGFHLTKRNAGGIILSTLLFFIISFGVSFLLGLVVMGGNAANGAFHPNASMSEAEMAGQITGMSLAVQLINQVVSIFLTMGFIRIGLDFVSGKQISPAQLFSQGGKLVKALAATFLVSVIVIVGFILLIVPGIYLSLRFSCYLTAIVDRDLGIIESLKYSARITQNNLLRLLGLGIVAGIIAALGLIACGVGILFTYPVAFIAWMVAYRWLQYGSLVTQDTPGTQEPVLKI